MNTNETIEITDLEATNGNDIKGGPKKIFVGSLSVAEPQDDEARMLSTVTVKITKPGK